MDGLNGDVEVIRDQRWRVAIFGDNESTDHAKTQVLIFIDKLVRIGSCTVFYLTARVLVANMTSYTAWTYLRRDADRQHTAPHSLRAFSQAH